MGLEVEVEVMSKEIVKPMSPTPKHLRDYHFSFLDQLNLPIHNCMVYFFQANDVAKKCSTNEASNLLKKSLSQLLTKLYPLAGRLKTKDLLIDCNDDGVPYIETMVKCHLSHVINNPSPDDLSEMLPYEMDDDVDTVLAIQFNFFECGGIGIGVCLSHKVADAMSLCHFIKSWASVTRGEPKQVRVYFQSSSHFPPKDLGEFDFSSMIGLHKVVGRRFVFEASAIESLRTKYSKMKENNVHESKKQPSRFEVLSNFIFNRFIAATKEGNKKIIPFVEFVLNIRPRIEPPLPQYAFGNYYIFIEGFPTLDEKGEYDLGKYLRGEINKVDNDYIEKIRESKDLSTILKLEEIEKNADKGEIVRFHIFSTCRFPLYDIDFGWGNPVWAGTPTWKFKNVLIFKDTKTDGGIEVYVNMIEEDMAKFEHDEEFLAYVSISNLK